MNLYAHQLIVGLLGENHIKASLVIGLIELRYTEKVCLSIRRIFGKHSYDLLARHLEKIHGEFGLLDKTRLTSTDPGSNFLKAFRLFGAKQAEKLVPTEDCDSETQDETEDDVVILSANI